MIPGLDLHTDPAQMCTRRQIDVPCGLDKFICRSRDPSDACKAVLRISIISCVGVFFLHWSCQDTITELIICMRLHEDKGPMLR